MSRLLPRYVQVTGPLLPSKVERSINDPSSEITVHSKATAPGDRRKLRGIPVAGGACGTSPGTDPLAALIAKERREAA